MAKNKQHIVGELLKEIEKGGTYGSVMAVNGSKWQLPERTFVRYWKEADTLHKERQQAIKKALDEVDTAAAVEARKRAIMTAIERKEYLTKIITGEIEVPYKEIKWDANQKKFVTINFVELASHPTRIAAIAELNKMEGDYAPARAPVDDKGETVKPQVILTSIFSGIDKKL